MKRCAIYARKSTAQGGDEETKSVDRQITSAKAFAVEKGWVVAGVYSDDAISGGDAKKLVQRQALFENIKSYDALVMRDESRFSRQDGDVAFRELINIEQQGVEI